MKTSPVRYGAHKRAASGTPCALCGAQKVRPYIDHCHKHGWVRGPVCPACNTLMALIDRRAVPSAVPESLTLAALIAHTGNCPDCPPFRLEDFGSATWPPPRIVQFAIRLPTEMHEWLRREAFETRTAMNAIIASALSEYRSARTSPPHGHSTDPKDGEQ